MVENNQNPDNSIDSSELTTRLQITEDSPGKISEYIGTGKHARAAIAWQTIIFSFIAGGVISLALFFCALLKICALSIEDIKTVWAIFIPIITLALGYIFGKSNGNS